MFKKLISIFFFSLFFVAGLTATIQIFPQGALLAGMFSLVAFIGVHLYFMQNLPIHRDKRVIIHLSLALVLFGLFSIVLRGETSLVFILPMMLLVTLYVLQLYIVKKYLTFEKNILSEIFLLQSVIAMGLVVTEYWLWGLSQQIPLIPLKFLTLGTVSIIVLATSAVVKRIAAYIAVFITLVMGTFKILTQATVGPEFFFYIGLFSYYVGFIVDWFFSTTEAERKLSQNISATTVWIITIVAGGILLLIS
jgi:hypothetical protein